MKFIQGNRIEIRSLAGQLPIAIKQVTEPEELKQANQLSKLLDETIWETNQLMAKFVPTCSSVSKYIGSALVGSPICSYSPGEGKALNCLKIKEW